MPGSGRAPTVRAAREACSPCRAAMRPRPPTPRTTESTCVETGTPASRSVCNPSRCRSPPSQRCTSGVGESAATPRSAATRPSVWATGCGVEASRHQWERLVGQEEPHHLGEPLRFGDDAAQIGGVVRGAQLQVGRELGAHGVARLRQGDRLVVELVGEQHRGAAGVGHDADARPPRDGGARHQLGDVEQLLGRGGHGHAQRVEDRGEAPPLGGERTGVRLHDSRARLAPCRPCRPRSACRARTQAPGTTR